MSQITVCDACKHPLPKGLEKGLQLRMPGEEYDIVLLVLPAGGANICPTCIATKVTLDDVDGENGGATFTPERISPNVMNDIFGPVIKEAQEAIMMTVQQAPPPMPRQQPLGPQRSQMPGLQPVDRRRGPDMGQYAQQMNLNPVMPTEQDLNIMAQLRARRMAAERQAALQPMDDDFDDPEYDDLAQAYGQIAHQPPMPGRPPMGMGLMGV